MRKILWMLKAKQHVRLGLIVIVGIASVQAYATNQMLQAGDVPTIATVVIMLLQVAMLVWGYLDVELSLNEDYEFVFYGLVFSGGVIAPMHIVNWWCQAPLATWLQFVLATTTLFALNASPIVLGRYWAYKNGGEPHRKW